VAAGALGLDRGRAQARLSVSSAVMSFEHHGSPSTCWSRRTTRISGGPLPHPDRGRQRGDGARCQGRIEEQTRKLFDVYRLRDVPIPTFVNKLDCEGRGPIDDLCCDVGDQKFALFARYVLHDESSKRKGAGRVWAFIRRLGQRVDPLGHRVAGCNQKGQFCCRLAAGASKRNSLYNLELLVGRAGEPIVGRSTAVGKTPRYHHIRAPAPAPQAHLRATACIPATEKAD
jgi:hypothetical protein